MPDGNHNIIAPATDSGDWDSQNGSGDIAELRTQARAGGLRFEAYLPPGLAEWLFDQIEDGFFADPREAVFAIVGLYRDMEPHTAPREQLLHRACLASVFDVPQPLPPGNNVNAQVQAMFDNPPAQPAIWRNRS